MGNYIKISRDIIHWEWYKDEHTKSLFLHCIIKANWKDCNFKGVKIKRGEFVTSIPVLQDELSLTSNEVRTAIKHLKKTGEITVKPYSKFSVITVVNYDLYQTESHSNNSQITDKQQTSNIQTADKSQSINSLLTTIEEEKERETGKQDKQENMEEGIITVSNETVCQTDVRLIIDSWNNLESYGINPIFRLTNNSKRYKNLIARVKQYSVKDILSAIEKIRASDFLQGKNDKGWTVTFDWFVLPNNFPKVLEGNYDNRNNGDLRTGTQWDRDILSEWRNS